MGKKKDFSNTEKLKVYCWLKENISTLEIAKRLGRHPVSVRRHID